MEDLEEGAVAGGDDDLIAEVAGVGLGLNSNVTSTASASASAAPAPVAVEGLSVFYDPDTSHWFSQNVNLGSQSIPVLAAANQFYSATDNPSNREAIRSYVSRVNQAKAKDWTTGRQNYNPNDNDDDEVEPTSQDVYRKEYKGAGAGAAKSVEAGLASGLKNYVDHVQHDKFKSNLQSELKKSQESAAAGLARKYQNIENYDNPETLKEMLGILDQLERGSSNQAEGSRAADGSNKSSPSEAEVGGSDSAGAGAGSPNTPPQASSNMESCFDTPPLSNANTSVVGDDETETESTTNNTCTASSKNKKVAEKVYKEFINSLPLKPEAEYLGSGFKVKAQNPTIPPTPTQSSSSDSSRNIDKAQLELDLYFNSAKIKGTYKEMFGTSEEEYQELLAEMNPGLARDKFTYNLHHVKGLAKNVLAPALLPKKMIEASPTLQLYANSYNTTGDADGVHYNFNVPEADGGGGLLWDPSELVQQTPKDYVKLDQSLRSKFIATDMVLTVELYHHQQVLPFEQHEDGQEGRVSPNTSGKPPNITMEDLESLTFKNELEFVQKLSELVDKKSMAPTTTSGKAAAKKRTRKKHLPQPEVSLEIEILIASPIYALMNLFSCEQDYILKDEISDPKLIKRLGVVKQEEIPPVFAPVLVIGSNIYTDVEDSASIRVAAELLLSFNEKSHMPGGSGVDFQILPWTLPLSSLNLRFGFRYLYIHKIICEHQVAFTKCRVVRPGETELLKVEPRITVVNNLPIHMCKKHCNELARFIKISPVKIPTGLSGQPPAAGATTTTTTEYACSVCAEALLTFKNTSSTNGEFKLFRFAAPAGSIPAINIKKVKKLGRPKRKQPIGIPHPTSAVIVSDEKSNDDVVHSEEAQSSQIGPTDELGAGSVFKRVQCTYNTSGAGAIFENIYTTGAGEFSERVYSTYDASTRNTQEDQELGLGQAQLLQDNQEGQGQVEEGVPREESLVLPNLCISTTSTTVDIDNNKGGGNEGDDGGGEDTNAADVVMEFDLNLF